MRQVPEVVPFLAFGGTATARGCAGYWRCYLAASLAAGGACTMGWPVFKTTAAAGLSLGRKGKSQADVPIVWFVFRAETGVQSVVAL